MLRRLLNIASIVCLVACVALMGMWVRSYHWLDDFNFTPRGSTIGIGSASGRIAIGAMPAKINPEKVLMEFTHSPFADWRSDLNRIDRQFSIIAQNGFVRDSNVFAFVIPYWFAVLVVGALGFAPWSHLTYRFTLRTLFIAMTFFAVVLGMITWLDRAWIGK